MFPQARATAIVRFWKFPNVAWLKLLNSLNFECVFSNYYPLTIFTNRMYLCWSLMLRWMMNLERISLLNLLLEIRRWIFSPFFWRPEWKMSIHPKEIKSSQNENQRRLDDILVRRKAYELDGLLWVGKEIEYYLETGDGYWRVGCWTE